MRYSSLIFSIAPIAAALLTAPLGLAQAASSAPAQLAAPAVRITAAPVNDVLVTLKGNTPPFAKAQYDQGAAASTLATGTMSLLLRRSPAQEQALIAYLGALQDPHSGSYRKWLTPQAFGANFGIADQDLQTVEQWLQGQGFKIVSVPASRNFVQFSGTFGQVEQAFHTSIHRYEVNGQQLYSNSADPEIPAALAPVVAGVSPLNSVHPTPEHILLGHAGRSQATSHGMARTTGGAKPELTGTYNNLPFLYVTASDAATIYDSPNTLNSNYTGTASSAVTGSGVNIGLVGDSDLVTADYLNYRKLFLGETNPPSPAEVIDGVDPGVVDGSSAIEALLDAENAAALAPSANIYFYSSNDDLLQDGAEDAALRAIEDNNVGILSVSFGECEADLGVDGNEEFAALWQQAAAQGITVLVASGDSGSASCDSDEDAYAVDGLAVSGFASTPYNVAVGGTDFDALALTNGFTTYVSTTTQNNYLGSALSYIPENPWNDSISNNPPGDYTGNTAAQYSDGAGGNTTILAAGGGGPSTAGICPSGEEDQYGNCLGGAAGYPIPSFQQSSAFSGTPLSGSAVRGVPDVSLFASAGDEHQAAWALCSDNVTNGDTSATYTDCETDAQGEFYIDAVGGTSTSTPAFAGILALVSQSLGGKRLGLANQVLYNLAATQYDTVFHDVTAGNNSVPCASGSPNCGMNDFLAGYNAGTGYDYATGLGSVDISKLVSAWSGVTFTPTSVTLQVNGNTSPHGAAVTLSSTVTPSSATGTVSVVGPTGAAGGAVNEAIPLTNGTGTTADVTDLPGGSYSIYAYYPGDATHASSTSASIPVTVNPEASTLSLYVQEYDPQSNDEYSNPATVPYGWYGYVYAEPLNGAGSAADGPASGTINLLNNGSAFTTAAFTSAQTLNSQGVAAYPLYELSPAAYSFTASYSGDSSYKASTAAAVPLTVQKGNTTLTAAQPSLASVEAGSTVVAVELDTDSVGAAPTGNITLAANGATYTATQVEQGTLDDGAVAELANIVVPNSALSAGNTVFTASYAGDGNYASTSSQIQQGFNVTGPANGIDVSGTGATGSGVVNIASVLGFSGTVGLSCHFSVLSLSGSPAPSCSIKPASVNITGSTAATATVTVSTPTGSSSLEPGNGAPLHRLLFGGSGVALAGLLLFGVPARRRSWRSMLVVLLGVGLLGAIGCGTGGGTSSGSASGTYTLTVTGTSGNVTANTQISVTVD